MKFFKHFVSILLAVFFLSGCGSDDTPQNSNQPGIELGTLQSFGSVVVNTNSTPKTLTVKGNHLSHSVTVTVSEEFFISKDGETFFDELQYSAEELASQKTLYIRFTPGSLGDKSGILSFISSEFDDKTIPLSGTGIEAPPVIHNYQTFFNQRLAFGSGHQQAAVQSFIMHDDVSSIDKIDMYVKLRCPSAGCNIWDMYANVQVKDPTSGLWYEIGRYITPYGVDNTQAGRGFKIDVTDFKSLLTGTVELRAFIEVWGADGWLLSIDFDYHEGEPDYPYYSIARIMEYNANSLEGVVYGEDQSAFILSKNIAIPANAEAVHLRTIISGWGHATPADSDGRRCAEWCFRTHHVLINGASAFSHYMGPIGCGSNPVQPQNGNWAPNRAGWCPGMEVPVRIDPFATSMAGQSFLYEYAFQPWTNNLQSNVDNPHAYYAISSFVVVKSSTPVEKAVVN